MLLEEEEEYLVLNDHCWVWCVQNKAGDEGRTLPWVVVPQLAVVLGDAFHEYPLLQHQHETWQQWHDGEDEQQQLLHLSWPTEKR